MRESSSGNLPAAISSIRVYLGGQELAISSPSDMPTIVFLSHSEEDELCMAVEDLGIETEEVSCAQVVP